MKIPALVELTWIDAHFDNGASTEEPQYEPALRKSVGYDLGVKNGAQGVAQSIDWQGHDDAAMFQDMLWIPKGMVKMKKVVRRALV